MITTTIASSQSISVSITVLPVASILVKIRECPLPSLPFPFPFPFLQPLPFLPSPPLPFKNWGCLDTVDTNGLTPVCVTVCMFKWAVVNGRLAFLIRRTQLFTKSHASLQHSSFTRVTTRLRCDGIFSDSFSANFPQSVQQNNYENPYRNDKVIDMTSAQYRPTTFWNTMCMQTENSIIQW